METQFDSLPWHDAELLSINIDRSNTENSDTVEIAVEWPDQTRNNIVFNDCWFLDVKMNFGINALETIREAECFKENDKIFEIREKWKSLSANLGNLSCYYINTNATNSHINIYALSFTLS